MVLFIVPETGTAQDSMVRGRVVDDERGNVLGGVAVSLRDGERTVFTNEAGEFSIARLRSGVHALRFRMLGYADRTDSVAVPEGETVEVMIRLSARAVPLEAVAVTARVGRIATWLASKGFSQRTLAGDGMLHLTHGDVMMQSGRNLDEIMRRTEGVRVRRLANGGGELLLEPSPLPDGRPCQVSVYLNGAAVDFGRFNWTGVEWRQRASRPMRFDDLLRLSEVDGIELYGPDERPVADAACGTLLLWSSALRPQIDEPFVGRVRGTAVDGTGLAVEGVRVSLQPLGLSAVTDANGQFSIEDVPPGEYEMRAVAEGASPWIGNVRVRAFAVLDIELRIGSSSALVALFVPVGFSGETTRLSHWIGSARHPVAPHQE
jgi:hypothetical protein